MYTRRTLGLALGSSVLLALAGCGSTVMVKSDKAIKVSQGEAQMVFMRASMLGGAITAAVYDVTGPEAKFIGLIDHSSKLAYPVSPGEHTFMVVSEAADFMKATVSAGKTYYALVTPRPGAWRARFSFKPLRQADFSGPDFAKWDSGTQLVENSPKSEAWAAKNANSIDAKRASYWAEWSAKAADQRDSQTLREEDGR
jgi:hypothetical protein